MGQGPCEIRHCYKLGKITIRTPYTLNWEMLGKRSIDGEKLRPRGWERGKFKEEEGLHGSKALFSEISVNDKETESEPSWLALPAGLCTLCVFTEGHSACPVGFLPSDTSRLSSNHPDIQLQEEL